MGPRKIQRAVRYWSNPSGKAAYRSPAHDRHGERRNCGCALQQVGEVRVLFIRNAVKLVAQAQSQSQIAPYFPGVLPVPIIFVLTKFLVIGGLADAAFVEELGVEVVPYKTVIGRYRILQRDRCIGYALQKGQAGIEVSIGRDRPAGEE